MKRNKIVLFYILCFCTKPVISAIENTSNMCNENVSASILYPTDYNNSNLHSPLGDITFLYQPSDDAFNLCQPIANATDFYHPGINTSILHPIYDNATIISQAGAKSSGFYDSDSSTDNISTQLTNTIQKHRTLEDKICDSFIYELENIGVKLRHLRPENFYDEKIYDKLMDLYIIINENDDCSVKLSVNPFSIKHEDTLNSFHTEIHFYYSNTKYILGLSINMIVHFFFTDFGENLFIDRNNCIFWPPEAEMAGNSTNGEIGQAFIGNIYSIFELIKAMTLNY